MYFCATTVGGKLSREIDKADFVRLSNLILLCDVCTLPNSKGKFWKGLRVAIYLFAILESCDGRLANSTNKICQNEGMRNLVKAKLRHNKDLIVNKKLSI
jgi:hypothetical protein